MFLYYVPASIYPKSNTWYTFFRYPLLYYGVSGENVVGGCLKEMSWVEVFVCVLKRINDWFSVPSSSLSTPLVSHGACRVVCQLVVVCLPLLVVVESDLALFVIAQGD